MGVPALLLRESLKKQTKHVFVLILVNSTLEPNVLTLYYHWGKKLHVRHPRGILNRNWFLVHPWPYITYANIYDNPKCFLFVDTNLTAFFLFVYFKPCKVYADVINGSQ